MKTITLSEALGQAAKGPFESILIAKGHAVVGDLRFHQIADCHALSDEAAIANAALLAHCRNSLPEMTEAAFEMKREFQLLCRLAGINCETHESWKLVTKDLLNAQNVRLL